MWGELERYRGEGRVSEFGRRMEPMQVEEVYN